MMNRLIGKNTIIARILGFLVVTLFLVGIEHSNAARQIDSLDLSGNCETVQQKAMQHINQINRDIEADSSNPGICSAARSHKLLGEIMVKVAEACQEIPTWKEEREMGRKMIQEAKQTINDTCV